MTDYSKLLPVVSRDTFDHVAHELEAAPQNQPRYQNKLQEYFVKMRRSNPVLAMFIESAQLKLPVEHREWFYRCCVLLYWLLDAQAEANRMDEEIAI